MFDAMAIKQEIYYDSQDGKMVGFVEPAFGDPNYEAKVVLVFMVVGLWGQWKMPVGLFVTHTLTAQVQSKLMKSALYHLNEAALMVLGVIMDGPAANVAMCEIL